MKTLPNLTSPKVQNLRQNPARKSVPQAISESDPDDGGSDKPRPLVGLVNDKALRLMLFLQSLLTILVLVFYIMISVFCFLSLYVFVILL